MATMHQSEKQMLFMQRISHFYAFFMFSQPLDIQTPPEKAFGSQKPIPETPFQEVF